jgi:hypothetical protein
MAQYPTAIATLPSVGTRTHFGTALIRAWVTEMIALQSEYNNTRGGVSTLAALLGTARSPSGALKSFTASHGVLKGITSSQHHNRLHGSSHQASDAIRLSKIGAVYQTGLLTTTQYKKLTDISSNATRTYATAGFVAGDGLSHKHYVIGFQADFIEVIFVDQAVTGWYASNMVNYNADRIIHGLESHYFNTGVTSFGIYSDQFQLFNTYNDVADIGNYFAIKRPEV